MDENDNKPQDNPVETIYTQHFFESEIDKGRASAQTINVEEWVIRLTLVFANKQTVILENKSVYHCGRMDPFHSWFPEVDLIPYGGERGGVSRHHARIFIQNNAVFVKDERSTNGTFVNEIRCYQDRPLPVRHGDVIRFGSIPVRVAIEMSRT